MKSAQFLKMKQLDRIEYLLSKNSLNEEYSIGCVLKSAWTYFWIVMELLVIGLLFYLAFKSFVILDVFVILSKVFKPMLLVLLIVEIIALVIHLKKSKKLDRRFLSKA